MFDCWFEALSGCVVLKLPLLSMTYSKHQQTTDNCHCMKLESADRNFRVTWQEFRNQSHVGTRMPGDVGRILTIATT